MLGLHAIKEKPVAINGKVEIRPMMYLALTYDHRLLDGREAVTFLVKVPRSQSRSVCQGTSFAKISNRSRSSSRTLVACFWGKFLVWDLGSGGNLSAHSFLHICTNWSAGWCRTGRRRCTIRISHGSCTLEIEKHQRIIKIDVSMMQVNELGGIQTQPLFKTKLTRPRVGFW